MFSKDGKLVREFEEMKKNCDAVTQFLQKLGWLEDSGVAMWSVTSA